MRKIQSINGRITTGFSALFLSIVVASLTDITKGVKAAYYQMRREIMDGPSRPPSRSA